MEFQKVDIEVKALDLLRVLLRVKKRQFGSDLFFGFVY